ncbi:Myosin ATPase [Handroanthus impetiginosus]|uniref:Myosin ATPase n=1 Tax=Handroanthus impetiginosus TaxID=429701 RepID=A0A2G9HD57_9LAMI|nr:Myosin ATPase [Handroanthus impetiginosus]
MDSNFVVAVLIHELLPTNQDILYRVSYLNEPSVLHNLQYRYLQDIIYSKGGFVLLESILSKMSWYGIVRGLCSHLFSLPGDKFIWCWLSIVLVEWHKLKTILEAYGLVDVFHLYILDLYDSLESWEFMTMAGKDATSCYK